VQRENATDVRVGETCLLPIRMEDVRSVAECRSPHYDLRINPDGVFVVSALSVGCGSWLYVDSAGEAQTHRICAVR